MQNKNNFSVLIVIIFLIIGFFLIGHNFKNPLPRNIKYVNVGNMKVKVELALTKETQAQGLSGRTGLGENEGMLFVFDKPGKYLFWMKNMNFAIDMIWIGEDLKIIYIKKDAQPEKFLETYGPGKDAKYVLEVVAGFADKYGVKEGDRVLFTY